MAKRDMDLVRTILLHVEAMEEPDVNNMPEIENVVAKIDEMAPSPKPRGPYKRRDLT